MSSIHPVPDNGGAPFFGMMGVSLALVLASNLKVIKILVQPMERLRLVQASAASLFGDLMLS